MNIKRYYWPLLFTLIFFSGVFSFLIFKNIYLKSFLTAAINDSQFYKSIEKILPSSNKDSKEKNVKILFGGDVSFDRYIRQVGENNGYDYVLSKMHDFLIKYDAVVVNFESPITNRDSISIGTEIGSVKNYIFTSDPVITRTLKSNNISVLNIGNNHIGNFGESGYLETINNLSNNGLYFFGNTDYSDKHTYLVKEFNGIRIGFVNFNQFILNGYEKAIRDIESIRSDVDVLVLVAHWDNEYQSVSSTVTKNRAHSFIDAGVDLVIGSHPHVIQSHEIYNKKHIYYSLGNFVFDQYFSPHTQTGLLVEMVVDTKSKEITTKEYYTYLNVNGQTRLME